MNKEAILLSSETGILVLFGEEGSQAGGLGQRESSREREREIERLCVREREGHTESESGTK